MKRISLSLIFIFSTALFSAANVLAEPTPAASQTLELTSSANKTNRLDELTAEALSAIGTARWSDGLSVATELVSEYPDYALGHWLLAETHNIVSMSDPLLNTLPHYSTSLVNLLLEAKARAQHTVMTTPTSGVETLNDEGLLIPSELVQVGSHIDNVVLVDLDSSMLYHFDTSAVSPKLITQHYISSGEAGYGKLIEGDNKTPLGIYSIHGFRSDESLPTLYGAGALMLNYPNALDRSMGRTGSGIWLHGNPHNERSRSPRSSEGCVTMANDHLLELYERIDYNRTHVVLTHGIQWRTDANLALQRERYQELFEQYKAAWANNQLSDLFSLYTNDALPEQVRLAQHGSTKRVSAQSLPQALQLAPLGIDVSHLIQVQSEDVSLLMNPSIDPASEQQHLVMSFDVNSANKKARITLYWERHAVSGYWQIKREVINAGEA